MDSCDIFLPTAVSTAEAGYSLAQTIYAQPLTLFLRGEMGAGKTTFVQGFAKGLGVKDRVTSPTYALEQRYQAASHTFIHLDLYRLTAVQARDVLEASNNHTGIRCIEWAERADIVQKLQEPLIDITLTEEKAGRRLHCVFQDIPLPSIDDIHRWRTDMMLPAHIAAHCDAVASHIQALSKRLLEQQKILRPQTVFLAAAVHDLFRFLDFRPDAAPSHFTITDEQRRCWEHWRKRFPDMRHEPACAAFLRERGYVELSEIVAVHGLKMPSPERKTIEQKLLFYTDKLVREATVVTLDERFDDFVKRYGKGSVSIENRQWLQEAKDMERELFG